ncbi:hypothetical protein LTR85_005116 [Meristemomyces frigidus]|nr:hypothetical protein LTR85_005116 [Meristemomyces frigidus]
MGYSLRRRLTRRQANEELRAHVSEDDDDSGSSGAETGWTARRFTSGDLSTPPPPHRSTIRQVSPSSSLLDRYKLRAPAAVAPSVSPAKLDHKTGRNTAFSEIFDTTITPIATPPATHPGTPVRETPDPILVRGAAYHTMTGPRDSTEDRRGSVEVMPVMETMSSLSIADVPVSRKRLTRSQSRRDKRQDSAADGVEQEMVDTKDFATARKDSSGAAPPGLTLRKNSNAKRPRTPSPDKNKLLSPGTMVGTTPANSPCNPSTQQLTSFCKNGTSTTDDYPSPDAISPDPLGSSSEIMESPSPAPTKTRIREFSTASGAVTVNPPRYDPTRIPLLQWCSSLGTTSRPEQTWGWMKKWTCCHCRAQTMVEQRECARLDCGHTRCHSSCKVIRGGGPKQEEAMSA